MDHHQHSSDILKSFNTGINVTKFPKIQLKPEEANNIFLKRRVELNEHTGTIKYVGKLLHGKNDQDIWIGIEWDDEQRGKHNGTVEGYEYFNTSHPTSGSLIKFSKVNFGGSFLDAIKFKYYFDNSEDEIYKFVNQAIENDMFIQANKKRILIEFVGKEKHKQKYSELENFRNLDLGFSFINEIGGDHNIFQNLKEINLQKTLLSRWSQFLEVLLLFKNLEVLNFSENILHFDEEYEKLTTHINSNELSLNHLVLNKCKISFEVLFKISNLLSKVHTLYLMGNELNETTYEKEKEFVDKNSLQLRENFASLSFLSLEKNNIKDFLKVYDILSAYNLSRLNLNQNHVASIIHNSEYSFTVIEKMKNNLQVLHLDFNKISELKILQEISRFLNLVDLDILNNKFVTNKNIEEIKCELVGRLMKLQTLNNTTISKDIRKDLEKIYLKNTVEEYFKLTPITDQNKFDQEKFNKYMVDLHPNYDTLKKKYYDPLEDFLENIKPLNTNTIKGNIQEVTIIYKNRELVKKFPKTTTFSNLRNLLGKLFKISGGLFLFYVPYELVTDEMKSLDNYSFVSDAKYVINLR